MNPAKILSFTKKTTAVLLLAGCLIPAEPGAALEAGISEAPKPNVSIHSALLVNSAVLGKQKTAVPASLLSFTDAIVSELSKQGSFEDWNGAAVSIDPLGPGTHSWLATVSRNGKPVGYLILTSTDDGTYMLSEYGREDSMPYNAQTLHKELKKLGIPMSGSKLPPGYNVEARYSALLPVWKITLPGQKAAYLHGITGEELPMQNFAGEKAPHGALTSFKNGLQLSSTVLPKQRTSDPYENLLWLNAPKLSFKGNQDLIRAVKSGQTSLVFTAPGHNADYGAPFVVTGLHSWQAAGTGREVLYAASGPNGSRFLPASELMACGEFRSLNISHL